MFSYSDPTNSGLLSSLGGIESYRQIVHPFYRRFALLPQSSFTLLDAFVGVETRFDRVEWNAFPLTANAPDRTIDDQRFNGPKGGLQDEYVEWRVERLDERTRITFTTEFPEFYEAFASVGFEALRDAIADTMPGANPTSVELFGSGFDPDGATEEGRQLQFLQQLPLNPWQNGAKGILCLQQRNNTMSALFNLVGQCAVPLGGQVGDACALATSGACGPGRASDPNICSAVQMLRRQGRVLSLVDPVGVEIVSIGGIWKRDGQQVDINSERDIWRIMRNGRRAVLEVSPSLTLADQPVVFGAQVARVLRVGATVVSALGDAVPEWARTGQESSRAIV